MSVLILKNAANEGAGTIEDFLRDNGLAYTVADLHRGVLPSPADEDTLVIMGGPMSVNEADRFPFIMFEEDLVREFMAKGRRILGICLGAQVMAKALGASVYPGQQKEIGWYEIELEGEGVRDPLMRLLSEDPGECARKERFPVFQWHGETFDIPEGAVRLAKSALYDNQAFRYGRNAYAFQFHIEVTREMIFDWLEHEKIDREALKRETDTHYEAYRKRAVRFYQAFFGGTLYG